MTSPAPKTAKMVLARESRHAGKTKIPENPSCRRAPALREDQNPGNPVLPVCWDDAAGGIITTRGHQNPETVSERRFQPHVDTRMARSVSEFIHGSRRRDIRPAPASLVMVAGHRRPSTRKRAGCGQGPRAPGKGPGALPLPTGTVWPPTCDTSCTDLQHFGRRYTRFARYDKEGWPGMTTTDRRKPTKTAQNEGFEQTRRVKTVKNGPKCGFSAASRGREWGRMDVEDAGLSE